MYTYIYIYIYVYTRLLLYSWQAVTQARLVEFSGNLMRLGVIAQAFASQCSRYRALEQALHSLE